MKILLEYLGYKEAGPKISLGIAKGFIANGHEVYAILSQNIENKLEWELLLPIERLFFVRTTPKKRNIVKTSKMFVADCMHIKKMFKDIMFDYTIKTFLVTTGWDKTICKCIKTRYDFNIIHDPIPHSSMNSKEAKRYEKIISKSTNIIVLSKKFIPTIVERYGISESNIFYMRHGQMSSSAEGTLCKTNTTGEMNYLFFGRIDGYKGLHVLYEAYSLLEEKYYDRVSITIAGAGNFDEYQDKYKSLLNSTVINRYVADNEVEELFCSKQSVLILPYLDATQSGVIPLAIQYGVPVIASDTGGLKEQLDNGNLGMFFEVGDAYKLFEQMEMLLVDHNRYLNMREDMITYAKRISWDEVIKDFIVEVG